MNKNFYVLFGYNATSKLKTLNNSKLFDFEFVSFKDFPLLNSFTSCNIKEIFLGWSFLLLKTSTNLYFSGYQRSAHEQQVVDVFENSNFCEVTCGMSISCIAVQNKKLYYFSNSKLEIIPISLKNEVTEIKDINTEDLYTVLLTQDGKVFDVNISDISVTQLNLKIPIKMVACGKEHVLLLTTTGVILSYGIGSRGQLGHGNIDKLNQPVVVEALDGLEIKTIAAGGWHSAAISYIGDLYMWGWNESGQLGLPCSQISSSKSLSEVYTVCCFPKIIELENLKVLTVSCGSRHTAAITEDKKVWTWGWNEYGQLGHNTCLLSDKPKKIKMPDNYIPQSIK